MRSHKLLGLALAAIMASALNGCMEADLKTTLTEDGSGEFYFRAEMTEKMVEIMHKLQELDPSQDMGEDMDDIMLSEPSDEVKKELAENGLEIVEISAVADDKQMKSEARVKFENLRALDQMDRLQEGGKAGLGNAPFRLSRDEEGVYTLWMSDDDKDEAAEEPGDDAPSDEEPGEMPGGGMEEDPEKFGQMMALMGEMMGEMQNFKMVVAMTVPGEVVSYSPDVGVTQDGSSVTWEFDMETMMTMGMGGGAEGGGDMPNFEVRFKMPEGKEIPESALWAGPEGSDHEEGGDEEGHEDGDSDGEHDK